MSYVGQDPGDLPPDEMYDRGREERILAEQQIAETKVLLEAAPTPATKNLSFFETLNRLRDASRCTTCGKSRVALNEARHGFRAEKVTPVTHCFCPDSPFVQADGAEALTPAASADSGREL